MNKDARYNLIEHLLHTDLFPMGSNVDYWMAVGPLLEKLTEENITPACLDIAEYGNEETFRLFIAAGGKFDLAEVDENDENCGDVIYRRHDVDIVHAYAKYGDFEKDVLYKYKGNPGFDFWEAQHSYSVEKAAKAIDQYLHWQRLRESILTLDNKPIDRSIFYHIKSLPPEQILVVADRNRTLHHMGMAPPEVVDILKKVYAATKGGLVILTSTDIIRNDKVFGCQFPVIATCGANAAVRLHPDNEIEYQSIQTLQKCQEILKEFCQGNQGTVIECYDNLLGAEIPLTESFPDSRIREFLDNLAARYPSIKIDVHNRENKYSFDINYFLKKETAFTENIIPHAPWQGRVILALGDDPEMDGSFLRLAIENGGYSFAVGTPIEGTSVTLKNTKAVLDLLGAVFDGEAPGMKTAPVVRRQETFRP